MQRALSLISISFKAQITGSLEGELPHVALYEYAVLQSVEKPP